VAQAGTETKAQRAERLKSAKNAWEHLDEIRAFARQGFESIPPEWLTTYFRPWGVYTQGDGAGAIGGKGGEGKALPFFMARVRVPNGLLSSDQIRAIGSAAKQYARGIVDITVRQNIQLHWLRIEDLPDVLDKLWSAGLTTKGACGDDARNITGCPVAGVDASEVTDASRLALELNQAFAGNAEFYNLPRKFKICITGCPVWCSYPEINDLAFTALRRKRASGEELGFSVRVGGALSTEPFLAAKLNAFVLPEQVLPVARAVAEIFRDSTVLRQSREKARLKYLFLEHGWNAESFLAELTQRLGFKLDAAAEEVAPLDLFRDHVGIYQQKQEGYSYVGASVLRGRLSAEQFGAVADLADAFADGQVRTTNMQNLLIVNVPNARAKALARELEALRLPVEASAFRRGAIACTGTEFCKLAITETKSFARWVVEELEERLPDFDQQIKLNITGCPNSCGQHWIADIGLEGKKIKVEGRLVDAYYFCVGGAVGREASIARAVGYRCLATEVPDAIERLAGEYRARRQPGENLRRFFHRHSNEQIRGYLAGNEIAIPVERDRPSGAVPHGVEG
jgi:sulfite reductase (ferredoxin)